MLLQRWLFVCKCRCPNGFIIFFYTVEYRRIGRPRNERRYPLSNGAMAAGEGCVCAGAHATALGRETVRLHVARLHVALLPVRRAVPALSLALGRQAVRLRRVRQAVLAVRPLDQARARPPQADGRQTPAVADAVTANAKPGRSFRCGLSTSFAVDNNNDDYVYIIPIFFFLNTQDVDIQKEYKHVQRKNGHVFTHRLVNEN